MKSGKTVEPTHVFDKGETLSHFRSDYSLPRQRSRVWNRSCLSVSLCVCQLGLFHLKGYRGVEDFFFQTLPPSFYIFRLDPPSFISQLCVGPPLLTYFLWFSPLFLIQKNRVRPPLPHFIFFDWTPPPSLHNYRLDPPSLLAFLKKSSTPPVSF